MLQMVGLLQSPLRTISVLVVHLLLVQFCSGQSQLIGPHQPIVATIGDDIILPCHLEPAMDVAAKTLEWTKTNLNPRFVYVWRASQDVTNLKNPSYRGRTSLFTGELKHGNISLKLSKVKPSDEGSYRCFIPNMKTDAFVELVVASDAVSSPVIGLTGIDRNRGGVILQCESEGWYPEPEVSWLDTEGHVLSAGPTETIRGPDGLYTVSSRVTVEKRHRNNFTCRVQQKDINQTRETQIHVPDDFFDIQSSFSSTVGLAASLSVCAVLIVLLAFFVWKWRQNVIRERKNNHKNKTKDKCVIEEEKVLLRTVEPVETKEKGQKNSKHNQQLQEKQRRQEAENNVETLKKDLETKKKEVETKQTELQQLNEEKQRIKKKMQGLNEDLEKKKQELETISAWFTWHNKTFGWRRQEKQREKKEAEDEVKRLQNELDTDKMELDTKMKEIEDKQAEVKQLQEEIPKMEADLQTLMETLANKSEVVELQRKLREEEQRRRRHAEKEVGAENTELLNEKKTREKAEEDLKNLRGELETKNNERDNSEAPGNSQRHGTSSVSQSSTTGPVIQVDRWCIYIRLTNTSEEDQQLGGWTLRINMNDTKPIKHTFDNSFKLSPGQHVTLWAYSYGYHHPPTDLRLKDLKSWSPADQLQIDLISNTGETRS